MKKFEPIVMAAKDAFIEKGFGNTSMDDIAARAGTTKRTIYNNFDSKERLLEAVIDHAIDLFEAAVPALGVDASRDQIAGFCEMLLQLTTWRAAIGLQRMMIAEGPSFPALAQHLATRISAAMCTPLSRLLVARGMTKGHAGKSAAHIVDILTSKGRLDRLMGLRAAYLQLPGKNVLDAGDRLAVEDAVRRLDGLDPHAAPPKNRSTAARKTKVDVC